MEIFWTQNLKNNHDFILISKIDCFLKKIFQNGTQSTQKFNRLSMEVQQTFQQVKKERKKLTLCLAVPNTNKPF